MVMEPSPNPSAGSAAVPRPIDPQFLGREFVRQYYTLLNSSPDTMYRFYAEDSSLVHGSSSRNFDQDPVYGQAEIQNRIMSLNFRDCHAKIRQLDSLETLGKGVVVQVTGELSNNGQPMRRFVQTFVLAPRSPTNYYVRNEIFRYQDDVFQEDEESSEIEKADLDVATKVAIETTLSAPEPVADVSKHVNGHQEAKAAPITPEPQPVRPAIEPLHVAPVPAAKVESQPQPPAQPPMPQKQQPVVVNSSNAAPVPAGKLSWASRVADSGIASVITPVVIPKPVAEAPIPPQTSPAVQAVSAPAAAASSVASGTPPKMMAKDARRGNRGKAKVEKPEAALAPVEVTDSQTDEKKAVALGDDHQVFVGNLPQDISEDELRKFFLKYGHIVDVRINRTNQKSSAGRTPNYGFVTFEEPKIVKSILSQKPIYFNEHRFNVEEKRSQGRGNNLNRSASGAGLNGARDRGVNMGSDMKNNRPPRADRKDGPRDRPFADRPSGERTFGDRVDRFSGDNMGSRKPGGAGREPSGAAGPAASGAQASAPLRQPLNSNTSNKR